MTGLRRIVWVGIWIIGPLLNLSLSQEIHTERIVRSAAVTVITSTISIDGVLDEQAWREAPTIGRLIQREPQPGEDPSERTDIKLLHDANNLYIGVVCFDSEPQKVIGTQMLRDADITRSDDRITIVLDTLIVSDKTANAVFTFHIPEVSSSFRSIKKNMS